MSDTPLRVAVIGAGPAGLFVGAGLARRGHEVIALERDPGPAERLSWDFRLNQTQRRSNVRMSLRLAALLFAALATSSAAKAAPGFTGNVCAMVSAKQVTAIAGISSKAPTPSRCRGPDRGSTSATGQV